jgi:hypothetical protein
MLNRILTLLIAFSVTAQIPLPDQVAYRCLLTGEIQVGTCRDMTCCQASAESTQRVCTGCTNPNCQKNRSAEPVAVAPGNGTCGCCVQFIIEGSEPTPIVFEAGQLADQLTPDFNVWTTLATPMAPLSVIENRIDVFYSPPPPDPSDHAARFGIFLL